MNSLCNPGFHFVILPIQSLELHLCYACGTSLCYSLNYKKNIIDSNFYRLLQISSFNGRMNALNEINKILSSVSYYAHQHGYSEEEWLTAKQMAVSSIF